MVCREKTFKYVIELIDKNISEDLSIDTICKLSDCKEWNLRRLFKRQAGVNIGEYIRVLRLKKAALLLKNSNKSVSRISVSTGFKSQQSFTRAFKRQFNDTPYAFRMRYIKATLSFE